MSARRSPLLAALLFALAHCAHHEPLVYDVVSPPRDFDAHPAILELDDTRTLYALSDVHGGYARMASLLAKNGLIANVPPVPDTVRWRGGDAVLVVVGDLMDKGPDALDAVTMLRALASQARSAGGQVVVLFGNHEAEFLADPSNGKATAADGFASELERLGILPVDVASGKDERGAWLRDLPFGLRAGAWFFAHAGNTRGRTVAELDTVLREAVAHNDFSDAELVGNDSLLEARGWYGNGSSIAERYAAALGAKHIVFGHEPDALGARGEVAMGAGGALFRIDCGMSPTIDDSEGCMLRVTRTADEELAEALDAKGRASTLWRGAP